jgi:hypothetical protein
MEASIGPRRAWFSLRGDDQLNAGSAAVARTDAMALQD